MENKVNYTQKIKFINLFLTGETKETQKIR